MNRFGFYEIKNSRDDNYTVKNGDTLYKISKEYDVSLEDLIDANNLKSTMIYPNQVIVVPIKVPTGAMYFEEYVIEPNDSLDIIGKKLGLDPVVLSRYNDISNLVLVENQKLKIPKNYKKYVILETDTLDTILKKTNMTLEELVKANSKKWLAVGSTIYVK